MKYTLYPRPENEKASDEAAFVIQTYLTNSGKYAELCDVILNEFQQQISASKGSFRFYRNIQQNCRNKNNTRDPRTIIFSSSHYNSKMQQFIVA